MKLSDKQESLSCRLGEKQSIVQRNFDAGLKK